MRTVVELLRTRPWPRVVMLALMTIGVAACSAESTRFNENPYATRSSTEATGSIPSAPPAQTGRIESRPLPATAQQVPPPGAGTAGGGRGMASYNPAATHGQTQVTPRSSPDITGTVAAKPIGNWTWDGGTPITVAHGDTVDSIARRYGVPPSAILQTNNLSSPATLRPGQPLVIPRYSNSPVATIGAPRAPAAVAARPAPASAAPGHPGIHIVAPGETLSKISRLYGKPLADVASANNLAPAARLKVGDRIVIPGVRTSKIAPKNSPVIAQAKAPAPKEQAHESVGMVAPVAETPAVSHPTKEATGALPSFRWPARGRVIAGYGANSSGVQNDGINIALPEGTPVKAAEDGVVAYAGNELKGYGNLLLVRHPNGYVTAYAHAKELLVKRGDQIKRGQVIAHSGQTGNVNAPQLHFEVRKGATPLDPTRYLSGG